MKVALGLAAVFVISSATHSFQGDVWGAGRLLVVAGMIIVSGIVWEISKKP